MISYHFAYNQPSSHLLQVSLTLAHEAPGPLQLQLPAWRPGRYEIVNFAKNILRFEARSSSGEALSWSKVSKDCWEVPEAAGTVTIRYHYYAHEMNAGSTWLDEEQLYINFINCAMYVVDRINEGCTVSLDLPPAYQVFCGLEQKGQHAFTAPDFYRLVDSPLIASAHFTHWKYQFADCTYHIVIKGEHYLDEQRVISDFMAFTKVQVETMGGFPCQDYYFLFQLLPYRHYHGVEHFNSTVITLGPGEQMHEPPHYRELLGVSSHELFHTWNVIRIRPEELTPYNLSAERYFETGYVAEGVTTFYGDYFLRRAGVFDQKAYLRELTIYLKRHFDNRSADTLSVAASSFDLWLDGYVAGVPFRKSSIYIKGALAALLLDLMIRKQHANARSLDDVLCLLWERYGKTGTGYSKAAYRDCCEEVYGSSLQAYFEQYIEGNADELPALREALSWAGLSIETKAHSSQLASRYGCLMQSAKGNYKVTKIYPGSPAAGLLSVDDEPVAINSRKFDEAAEAIAAHEDQLTLHVFRNNRLVPLSLQANGQAYFDQYEVVATSEGAATLAGWA